MSVSFWLELFIRSSALLLSTQLVLWASRRARPALRHRMIVWGLALLAVLPLLTAVLPEVRLSPWGTQPIRKAAVTAVEVSFETTGHPSSHPVNWLFWLWAAGALSTLMPLLIGYVAVGRTARRAKPFGDGILISAESCVPITCGLLRPRILLPAAAEQWSPQQCQAVLLHERAHLRRHDLATQVGAHLLACLWWFQPLVWVLRARLRKESEFAADAEVIRSGMSASEYASELLAVARSVALPTRTSSCAIAMAGSNALEERFRALLQPSQMAWSRPWTGLLAALLASSAFAASTVSLSAFENSHESGGSVMKRTILSALLTSAGLSAATLSGVVRDVNDSPVTNAKVTISEPNSEASQEVVTGEDGRFSFEGKGAGQYILKVEKAGFASIFREFDLKAEDTTERDLTLRADGASAAADNSFATGPEKKIRIGGGVAQANLVRKVAPVYPPAAKSAGTQGTVELETIISKEGVPVEIRVVSSPSDDLSASALEAVGQWRYRPTLLNGESVEVVTRIIVNYTLTL